MQEYISKFTGAEIDARLENTINVYDNLDSLETSAVKDGSIATCCFDDVGAMKLSETNVVTEQDTNDSFDILNPGNITSGITGIEVIAPSEIYSSIERAMVIFVSEDHDMNTNPEIIMISTNTNNNNQPY